MIKNIDKMRESQALIKKSWIESKILNVGEVDVASIIQELNFIKKSKAPQSSIERSISPAKSKATRDTKQKAMSIFDDDNVELGSIRSLRPLQSSS